MTDQSQGLSKRGLSAQAAADLADLFHELSHDKKTRAAIGRIVREAKPDSRHAAAFSDIEQDDKFESFKREQEDREVKRQQDAVMSRLNQQRTNLLTGGADGSGPKYDEDTVKKIEKFMEDKGYTDYEDAAVLWAAKNPPLTRPESDPSSNSGTWEFPAGSEEFFKDEKRASRNIAHQVIGEFMRKRG